MNQHLRLSSDRVLVSTYQGVEIREAGRESVWISDPTAEAISSGLSADEMIRARCALARLPAAVLADMAVRDPQTGRLTIDPEVTP